MGACLVVGINPLNYSQINSKTQSKTVNKTQIPVDKTTGIKDAYYNNSFSLSLLTLSHSLSLWAVEWVKISVSWFPHQIMCKCVCACVCVCVCVCAHVAAKCVNVNLQGLPVKVYTHTHTHTQTHTQAQMLKAPLAFTCTHMHRHRHSAAGQCEVGHCSPDTNIKKFSKEKKYNFR